MAAHPQQDSRVTSAADAQTLCTSCALCCTGVIFPNAQADPDEVPRLESAGLTVERFGDRLQFRLPCHHNVGGRCAIYEDRFKVCRMFRCALLKRLELGDVTLPEALAKVAHAKRIVAHVAALDPPSALAGHRIARRAEGVPAEKDDPAARLWLEGMALDVFLDSNFRNKPILKSAEPDEMAAD